MTRWLVVGAGAAGCVVAARLSENPSNEVRLLDAGPEPGGAQRPMGRRGDPVLDQEAVASAPDVVRRPGGVPEPYAQGFGLGGSSLINAGVVVGDVDAERIGHDLPIEPPDGIGPVARAVMASTPDAAAVAHVAKDGLRVSAADAYLWPAGARSNLTVLPGRTVERVMFDGRRVIGAVDAAGDWYGADRVVMCAGAIGSPAILLRSGVDTPGVGAGLQDHVGFAVSFELPEPVDPALPAIGVTVERTGRQIIVMDRLPAHDGLAALIAGHLAVASVGRVTVPDPDGPPLVQLGQLTDPSDLDGLSVVAREALDLMHAPVMRSARGAAFVDDQGTSIDELADAAALRAWLPSHLGGYHHASASCRIGVCLADDGSLIDYEGLFVADASAFAGVPARNPYLSVVRQAERLAAGWRSQSP